MDERWWSYKSLYKKMTWTDCVHVCFKNMLSYYADTFLYQIWEISVLLVTSIMGCSRYLIDRGSKKGEKALYWYGSMSLFLVKTSLIYAAIIVFFVVLVESTTNIVLFPKNGIVSFKMLSKMVNQYLLRLSILELRCYYNYLCRHISV